MLIIQSLFSRLRNIQTRNRGRIVIPASAPPAWERPRCGWMIGGLYSKRGEGWMRPTFVLQHLHFFGLSSDPYSSSEKRKIWLLPTSKPIWPKIRLHNKSCRLLFATARSYFMSNNEKCLFHASFCLPRSLSLAPPDVRGKVDLVGQLADVDLEPVLD